MSAPPTESTSFTPPNVGHRGRHRIVRSTYPPHLTGALERWRTAGSTYVPANSRCRGVWATKGARRQDGQAAPPVGGKEPQPGTCAGRFGEGQAVGRSA